MSENQCWTSAEVAEESTSRATNRAAIASRWVRERKSFLFDLRGSSGFPDFNFKTEDPYRPFLRS